MRRQPYSYGSNTKKIQRRNYPVKRGIHYDPLVFDFHLFIVIDKLFRILFNNFVVIFPFNIHLTILSWIVIFIFLIFIFLFDFRFGLFFFLFLFVWFFTERRIYVK